MPVLFSYRLIPGSWHVRSERVRGKPRAAVGVDVWAMPWLAR